MNGKFIVNINCNSDYNCDCDLCDVQPINGNNASKSSIQQYASFACESLLLLPIVLAHMNTDDNRITRYTGDGWQAPGDYDALFDKLC